MKEEILLWPFAKGSIPEYKCPICSSGVLRLHGGFNSQETIASQKTRQEDYWDIEFVDYRFSCCLACSSCQEQVFVVGHGGVDEEYEIDDQEQWHRVYREYYSPEFFYPALKFVECPPKTPWLVMKALETAGALYFTSPSSCCNSIRIAAEETLTDLGVPVLREDGGFFPFAQRIQKLETDNKSLPILFHAIRFLGNSGSHSAEEVTKQDALHAFNIFGFILDEAYGDKKTRILELAEAINSNKGPIKNHKPFQ